MFGAKKELAQGAPALNLETLESRILLTSIYIEDFFPLDTGAQWTYERAEGDFTETETITVLGPTTFDSHACIAVATTGGEDNGEINYMGFRGPGSLYGYGEYEEGSGEWGDYTETTTYTAPDRILPNIVVQNVPNTGGNTYDGIWTDSGGFTVEWHGNESRTITFTGWETVTVPAGTFECARFSETNNWSDTNDFGDTYSGAGNGTLWLAEGVGIVHETWTETEWENYIPVDVNVTDTRTLLSYSGLGDPPLPSGSPDAYETNDTRGTAANLGMLSGSSSYPGLSIHSTSDEDWYQFTIGAAGQSGDQVRIDFIDADGDLDMKLYDASENRVGSSTGVTDVETISLDGLPAGTYHLNVYGWSSATNDYDLSITAPLTGYSPDAYETNDSSGAATNLSQLSGSGSLTGLNVHSTSDEDWFRFELADTGTASHFIQADFAHAGGDIDVKLYDSSGSTQLDSETSVTDNETVSLQGLAAGTYYLRVYGYGSATNSYGLSWNAPVVAYSGDAYESNETLGTAADLGALDGSGSVSGLSIHSSADEDWFGFTIGNPGGAADYVGIAFADDAGDLDLALYDPTGTLLDSSASVTDNEEISLNGLAAGTYYIRVYGWNGAENNYSLHYTAPPAGFAGDAYETNNTQQTAHDFRELGSTTTATGLTIHNADDDDWFSFTTLGEGTSSHYVAIDFAHAHGDLDMKLYDGSSNLLGRSTSITDDEQISLDGLAAGTYYIHVYGWNEAVNGYDLTIEPPVAAFTGDNLEPNDNSAAATEFQTVAGAVTVPGLTIHANQDNSDNVDWFKFTTTDTGTASHYVEIQFAHADGDLDMRLYSDPSGSAVGTSTSVTDNERISLEGLAADTYYIYVYGYNDANNDYDLVISAPTGPQGPTPDAQETNDTFATATDLRNVSGSDGLSSLSIHDTSDVDWFKFTTQDVGTSSHYVEIQFAHADGDLDMELYDANEGALVSATSTSDDERISLENRPAMTYYLKVYGYSSALNTYDLVLNTPAAPTTTPGTGDYLEPNEASGSASNLQTVGAPETINNLSIHSADDQDWFQFTTTATGTSSHYLDIDFTHADGDLDMKLYNSSQTMVGSGTSTSDDERISLDGLAAGTYYLVVYGYGDATNNYTLSIVPPSDTIAADNLEANDSSGAATDLQTVNGSSSIPSLTIHSGTDTDWFQFTTTETGGAANYVEIQFADADGNLDLYLYSSSNQLFALDSATSTTDNERISLDGLAAGTYYAKVASSGTDTNRYSFVLNAPQPAGALPEWSFLVYIDGDNNLEGPALDDINEMEAVNLPADVQVGVMVDRISGYSSADGNWTDTRRGLITRDSNTSVIGSTLTSIGEQNLGNPTTLTQFIQWGAQTIPAENYAVILWNHGGATSGVCWDDTNSHDQLTLDEVAQGVANSGVDVDILGFDACLMANIETTYAIRNVADYHIASEEIEGGDGWDYTRFLNDIIALPSRTPEQVASTLIDHAPFNSSTTTLSAVQANPTALYTAINAFTTAMNGASSADWTAVINARDAAPGYYYPDFRDLGAFMTNVANGVSNTTIANAAATVRTAYDNAITNNYSTAQKGGTGLTAYLPSPNSNLQSGYTAQAFAADLGWGNFVTALASRGAVANRSFTDWAENNNVQASANNLGTLTGDNHQYSNLSLHTALDDDWFMFTTGGTGDAQDRVSIDFTNASGNLDLYLYDASGTLLTSSVTSGDSETVSLSGRAAGTYFVKVDGAANPSYTLTFNAPGAADDWAEGDGGNDTREKAQDLVLDSPHSGLNLQPGDEDWYHFTTARLPEADGLRFDVTYDTSAGTIVMTLFDAQGNQVATSTPTGTGAEIEQPGSDYSNFFLRVTETSGAAFVPYAVSAGHDDTVAPPATSYDFGTTYADADGNNVSIRLMGNGAGQVVFNNGEDNPPDLVITGANTSTMMMISGTTTVNDVTVEGSLNFVLGRSLTIEGDMTLTGGMSMFMIGNIDGGTVTTGEDVGGVMVMAGNVSNATLDITGGVRMFMADQVSNSNVFADDVSMLMARGGFSGTLATTGEVGMLMANSGTFSGILRAGSEIGMLMLGDIADAIISTAGNIRMLMCGDIIDSHVLAGYDIGVDLAFGGTDDVLTSGNLSMLMGSGEFASSYLGAGACPTSPLTTGIPNVGQFASGGNIGMVRFGSITYDNNSVPFGLYAAGTISGNYTDQIDFLVQTAV